MNQRSLLIQAAIKAVRIHGMDGVRMQHIGQIAHATPSSIYQYFKGKDELLRVCYEQIDREIAYIFEKMEVDAETLAADPEKVVHMLWTAYWRWLVDHPDEAIFHHYYREWPGFPEYDMARDVSHFDAFVRIIHLFYEQYPSLKAIRPIHFWLYWLDGTGMYAKYVAQGLFPDNQETEDSVFTLLMGGISAFMRNP